MKKLLLTLLAILATSAIFAQEKSNYERYREAKELEELGQSKTVKNVEYDDIYFRPDKDTVILKQKKTEKRKNGCH